MRKLSFFILIMILTARLTPSQIAGQRGPAKKIDQAIQVDGLLDETEWNRAPEANEFIAAKEQGFDNSGFNTVSKILFDENSLFLGLICYDGQPDLILSEITEQDADIRDDDSVFVLLESPKDMENLYYFATNLTGARLDGMVEKALSTVDTKWNGNWRAAARKTAFGWTAEIAIDLSSLNIKPGENIDLGLKISRVIPRADSLFRKGPLDPAYDLDNLGSFQRLELIRTFTRAEFQAHILSNFENNRPGLFIPGLQFQYALTSETTTEINLNPDFITIEPDEEIINLRLFELDVPEKRIFFLSGSDAFQQSYRLFHSKRIGEIYGGLRIKGEEGGLEFTGLSVQGKNDIDLGFDKANYSSLRLRKTLLPFMRLGLTAANKRIGGSNFGAAGMDADFFLSEFIQINGRVAASYGDYESDNLAFSLGPKFQNGSLGMHFLYHQIGEKFGDNVNHIGFIPDDNRKGIDTAFSKIFSFESGRFQQIEVNSTFQKFHGKEGTRRIELLTAGTRFHFQSSWEIKIRFTREYRRNENIRGPVLMNRGEIGVWRMPEWVLNKGYQNQYISISSGMNKNDGREFSLGFTMGKNFGLMFQMAEFRKQLAINRQTSFDLCFYHISYEGNHDAWFKTTSILLIKGHQNLNPKFRLQGFFQYHSVLKKATTHFSLEYQISASHGSIWLGYQRGTSPFGFPEIQDHSVILKISYRR